MPFLEAIILSLVIASIRKGDVRLLGKIRLRKTWLIFAPGIITGMLFLRHVPGLHSIGKLTSVVQVTSYLMVLAFMIINRRLAGMSLIAVGAALNFAVMTANGGKMPVSYEAVKKVHMEKRFSARMVRHCTLDEKTKLPMLADILPRPWPPFPERDIMSVGDIFLSIGLFVLVQYAACPRKKTMTAAHDSPSPWEGEGGGEG